MKEFNSKGQLPIRMDFLVPKPAESLYATDGKFENGASGKLLQMFVLQISIRETLIIMCSRPGFFFSVLCSENEV